MGDVSSSWWGRLERSSPTLFLIATGLLVVHAVTHGLVAFAGIEYPMHHEFPFGVSGMVLGFVALLGIYPTLADRMPKLASLAAAVTILGGTSWLVMGLGLLAEELGAELPAWIGVVGLGMLLGVILAYLAFGVASLWTNVVSRTAGFALLAPALVMVLNFGVATAGYGSLAGQFVVATGFALAHLAIWGTLRTESTFTRGAGAASEAIT
jgi:hypothetical protein